MPIDEDSRGAYIMNSRDLCLMPHLAEIIDAGPDSLKIEGRNRSEYYVGMVTNAYRCAMDAYAVDPAHFDPAPFMAELNKLEQIFPILCRDTPHELRETRQKGLRAPKRTILR